jgi:hypothetical protein
MNCRAFITGQTFSRDLDPCMTTDEAQRVMFLHWPGFMPMARIENGRYLVRLVTWPPSDAKARPRGELEAHSSDGFAAALLDLASWTAPLIRCRESSCVLCGARS